MCSRRINIIDISMERCSRFTSGGTPSIRRVRNSRRRDVAKRPSSVSEFTCCYATSSRVLYVGTSTRFHRTVIDRGSRCGSRRNRRYGIRHGIARAAHGAFSVSSLFRLAVSLSSEREPNPLDYFVYFSDPDETDDGNGSMLEMKWLVRGDLHLSLLIRIRT